MDQILLALIISGLSEKLYNLERKEYCPLLELKDTLLLIYNSSHLNNIQ